MQVHGSKLTMAVAAVADNAARCVGHFTDHDADSSNRFAVVGQGRRDGALAPCAVHEDTGVPVLVRLGAVVDPGLGALATRAVVVISREPDVVGDRAAAHVGVALDAPRAAARAGGTLLLDEVGSRLSGRDESEQAD